MTNHIFILFMTMLTLLIGACSNPESSYSKIDPSIQKNYNAKELLKLHNDARSKGGRCGKRKIRASRKLTWNIQLAKAANYHSSDMAKNHFFSHINSNGKNTKYRVNAAGYKWQKYAENLAHRQPTPDTVFKAWIERNDHCRNILDRDFKEMGAAVVDGYWTVVFGKPAE